MALRRVPQVSELLTPEVCMWMMSTTSRDQALPSLEELAQRPEWMVRAQCRGEDRALFFPERGASTRQAKEMCRDCVVREECLSYAMADSESAGVWAGLSERERRKLRSAA
jgi:WhiB family redox-sensing transcriptional regulator